MANTFDPRIQPFSTSGTDNKSYSDYWKTPQASPQSGDMYAGFQLPNLTGAVDRQRSMGQRLLGNQDLMTSNFLGNYGNAIGGQEKMRAMYGRLGDELGLPGLQRNAQNLTAQLEAIPQTYANATRGFDVNANQLARIQNTKAAQLAPLAQKATTQAQNAQNLIATQMQLGQAEQQKELLPYQMQGQFLTDRLARETSMFTQDNQNELQALTAKMNAGIQLTEAEKNRAQELEVQRRNFENSKALAEQKFGYDKQLLAPTSTNSDNWFFDPNGGGWVPVVD